MTKLTDRDALDRRVHRLAAGFQYPPTPNLRPGLGRKLGRHANRRAFSRTLGWALAATLLLAVTTVALVPAARAALLEAVQLGVVRILVGPADQRPGAGQATETGLAASSPAAALLDLAGEASLAEAAERFPRPLRLPAYPGDLGLPDRAYLQGDPVEGRILVWLSDADRPQVEMALFEVLPNMLLTKFQPRVIERTLVNSEPALWTEGPYPIELASGALVERWLIEGHVLIWVEDGVSYRLETNWSLEEAIRVAESLSE